MQPVFPLLKRTAIAVPAVHMRPEKVSQRLPELTSTEIHLCYFKAYRMVFYRSQMDPFSRGGGDYSFPLPATKAAVKNNHHN